MSAATSTSSRQHIEEARHTLGAELEQFATNTLEYLKREHHLATDSPDLPEVRTSFKDRHALIVVRGIDYREDLAALKRSGYLREVKPVTIGVDGGADALLELGIKPDIIIGDFDSVSDAAMHCGAELIVHAYLDGKAPGCGSARRRSGCRSSSSRPRARARTSPCSWPTSWARR